jgi:hypothetical protein
MAIDDPNTVDGIGTETSTEEIVLVISDHLDWTDPQAHLAALQDKANAYLGFIESGDIYQNYPDARGRRIRIDLITEFPIPAEVARHFSAISEATEHYGVGFAAKMLPERYREGAH